VTAVAALAVIMMIGLVLVLEVVPWLEMEGCGAANRWHLCPPKKRTSTRATEVKTEKKIEWSGVEGFKES
jgi:hypothetical protein